MISSLMVLENNLFEENLGIMCLIKEETGLRLP